MLTSVCSHHGRLPASNGSAGGLADRLLVFVATSCASPNPFIVIEQAAQLGVGLSFRDHARVGIPVTLFSLAVLAAWILI